MKDLAMILSRLFPRVMLVAACVCVGACSVAAPTAGAPPATVSTAPAPATSPTPLAFAADLTIDQVEARYERARFFFDLVALVLPAEHADRLRKGQAIFAAAIAAARAAVTTYDREAQLRRAAAEVDRIEAVASLPAGG